MGLNNNNLGRLVGKEQAFEVPRYLSHLEPCKQADKSLPPWKGDSEWKEEGGCADINTANATPQDHRHVLNRPHKPHPRRRIPLPRAKGIRDGRLNINRPIEE